MARRSPRWVLCQGARHGDAPDNALRIGVGTGDWERVAVGIEGLEDKMTGRLPPALHDLMMLAAFVLAADCATPRGTLTAVDNGDSWRRELNLVVPVRDLDRWQRPALLEALEKTLGYLSDDLWRLHFVPQEERVTPAQVQFTPAPDGRTFASWDAFEDVLLFSGGMDSFSGVVDACLAHRRKPLLVSHHSSTKIAKVQRDLLEGFRPRSGGYEPGLLAITVQRESEVLRREDTQRSRSFLYAAIAGAVSWLAGHHRLTFHENGIIGLNLPITAQLLGARATRTAHPRVLDGFARILALVADQEFEVQNPYQWHTRADVARNLRDRGVADLLRRTRSCAGVRVATKMHPFCGVCSQCVDRQFAVRAAGLLAQDPEEMYAIQLFNDPLSAEQHVQVALSYVAAAGAFAKLSTGSELVSRYGEVLDATDALARQWQITPDAALDRLVDLHRRQGEAVLGVLASEVGQQTPRILDGANHPTTLLSRCLNMGLTEARQSFGMADPAVDDDDAPAVPAPPPARAPPPLVGLLPGEVLSSNVFYPVGYGWLVGLAKGRAVVVKSSPGMDLIRTLLRHPHTSFSPLALEAATKVHPDVIGNKGAAEQVHQSGSHIGLARVELVDEQTIAAIRERIRELEEQEREAEEFSDTGGATTAREQREALMKQLTSDLGYLGRSDRPAPEVERARVRVTRAITRALADIAKVDIPTKRHLAQSIRKGGRLAYEPEGARTWTTDR